MVMLPKRLSLIHNSKIHRLITNLVSMLKIGPHLMCHGETPKSKGKINIHVGKNSLGACLLTEPCLVHSKIRLVRVHLCLKSVEDSIPSILTSIWRIGEWCGETGTMRTDPVTLEVAPKLLPTHMNLQVKSKLYPVCSIEQNQTSGIGITLGQAECAILEERTRLFFFFFGLVNSIRSVDQGGARTTLRSQR